MTKYQIMDRSCRISRAVLLRDGARYTVACGDLSSIFAGVRASESCRTGIMRVLVTGGASTLAQAVVLTLDQGVVLIQVLAVELTPDQVAVPIQAQAVELTPDQVVGLILAPEDPVIQVQVVAVMTNGTALPLTANRI